MTRRCRVMPYVMSGSSRPKRRRLTKILPARLGGALADRPPSPELLAAGLFRDGLFLSPGKVMIRRAPRNDEFTVLENDTIEDDNLSWEATGLLTFLLSKPDDWTVRVQHLINCRNAGRHKIKRVLSELEEAGYLIRHRTQDDEGKFQWESVIFETPREEGQSIPRKSVDGSSVDGSSVDGQPGDITKTEVNKEGINKNGESTPARGEDNKAVEMYHETFPRRANNIQQDLIEQTVDDLDVWGQVLEYWRGNGYRGKSVRKMLDKYEEDTGQADPEGNFDGSWPDSLELVDDNASN